MKHLQSFLKRETKIFGNVLDDEGILRIYKKVWGTYLYHLKSSTCTNRAVLNSRPLVPMSSSHNDLDILTPSHFIIGRTFIGLPDPNASHHDLQEIPLNYLTTTLIEEN